MKKVALVLLLAVVAPSLALAWLAVRSLRDSRIPLAAPAIAPLPGRRRCRRNRITNTSQFQRA